MRSHDPSWKKWLPSLFPGGSGSGPYGVKTSRIIRPIQGRLEKTVPIVVTCSPMIEPIIGSLINGMIDLKYIAIGNTF